MTTTSIPAVAVNKFIYYTQNFGNMAVTMHNGETVIVPDFFKIFSGRVEIDHFCKIWEQAYRNYGCHSAVIMFYVVLNDDLKSKMIEYIMNNYNSEHKLK